jgi:hypothetical protein
MVPLIGGLLTLGSLATQALGLASSAKLNRQRQKALNDRKVMNDTYFNKEYYANMQDRAPVKSTMQLITDRIKKQQTENASKAAITGATDESQLAAGQAQNEAYDQTLKGLAENETQIQQSALERKRVQDNEMQVEQNKLDQDKAESTQNLINSAVSLGQTVAGANFSGVEKKIGSIFKKPTNGTTGKV